MKNLLILIFIGFFVGLISPLSAQKFSSDKPITINNIPPEKVWQVIEMTLKEKGFGLGKFLPEENKLLSNWIEWSTIGVKNRGRLFFTYSGTDLTLQMADRQYQTKDGWTEAIGNLSKKNYADYLQSVTDRITAINGNEAETKKAIKASELFPAFNTVNKVGELTWTLIKTNNPEDGRPVLDFNVYNAGADAVKVNIQDIRFHPKADDIVSSNYGDPVWSKLGEKKQIALIQPGETLMLVVKLMQGSSWKLNSIPKLSFKIECDAGSKKVHILKIYNIPVTGYVFNPEEQ